MTVEAALGKSLAEWPVMKAQSSRMLARSFAAVLLLAACLCTVPGHAATTLHVQSIALPGIDLRHVDARLDTGPDGQLHLHLEVARADVAALGWRHVGVTLDGQLLRSREELWSCRGTIRLRGAPGGLFKQKGSFGLILDVGANTLQLDLGHKSTPTVTIAMPLDQTTHLQMHLENMPLSWLQGPLSRAWTGRLTSGQLSGTMAMDINPDGLHASASMRADHAGFDAGSVAAENLGMDGRLKVETGKHRDHFSLTTTLKGGKALLGPIYAQLPDHPTQLAFNLEAAGGSLRLDHLRYTDPDTLSLAGGFIFSANGHLHSMNLSRFSASLPEAYERYGKTWLATLGLRNLTTSGQVQGSLLLGASGPEAFAFQADDVSLAARDDSFRIEGLNGGLDWRRMGTRPESRLAWKRLGVYRIAFGAGDSHWHSRGGVLSLVGSVDMPVLGGQLVIHRLNWQPHAKQGEDLDMASVVTGVDMGALSRTLGWPRFHGTLAGAMPGLHVADGRFAFQGGLSLHVFDGFVDITHLSLTDPFGGTPEMAADVSMSKLNLGAMTDVFDFGKITGQLHGRIDQLHLVDWQPVKFKARLLADSGGRISQRAVNNLTSVGGGGVVGGIQGAVLKLFKSFRYDRIGLSCTLEGNVCHMSGLEKAEDGGYLIVDGSGLPHLTVIGHQERVSWPTLVSRLKAAINSGGPVVK